MATEPSPYTSLPRERLHQTATAQIKGLIASGRLRIGQRLAPERELAQRMGVSRVVVREALRSLEQAGLIEIRPGASGGSFVTQNLHKPLYNSVRDLISEGRLAVRHFFEARRVIECATVALASARATNGDIETLQAINARLLRDSQDNTTLREHNAAFHMAIADISGNPLMKLLVQSLMELLNTVFPQSVQRAEFIRATFQRHEAIIAAIRGRNEPLCRELMARDTEFTLKLRRAVTAELPPPPRRGRGRPRSGG